MIGNTKLKRTLVTATAVALAAAGPLAACGSDDEAADDTTTTAADAGAQPAMTIENVWARPGTAGGNSAVYMTLNGGDTDDALVGVTVSADVVEAAEIHETVAADDGTDDGTDMGEGDMTDDTMADEGDMSDGGDMGDDDMGGGMMTMQEVDSIAIPAGVIVTMEPGGYHVMLLGLTKDLVVGDTFEVTLNFESGATETVTAEVQEV